VLLVTRSGSLYWHVVQNNDWGPTVNWLGYSAGANYHLRIEVNGSDYKAYVDDTLITSLSSSDFSNIGRSDFGSGSVGLYDFSDQRFDDFEIQAVPAPAALVLLCSGLAGLLGIRRLRKG